MIIAIPTHKREDDISTLKFIPEQYLKYVHFFTDETRVEILRKNVPKECKIISVASEYNKFGIAGKRHIIMKWCRNHNIEKVWQLDDQLSLQLCEGHYENKLPKIIPKYRNINVEQEFEDYYNYVSKQLDNYVLVGSLNRSGTYFTVSSLCLEPDDVYKTIEQGRIYSNLALNVPLYFESRCRFNNQQKLYDDPELSLMEDYSLIIQLSLSGYKTLQITKYIFDKVSGKIVGGCSEFRNNEMLKKNVLMLHKTYPEYVKVSIKKVNNWKSLEESRYAVIIYWKKLRKITNNNTKDLNLF